MTAFLQPREILSWSNFGALVVEELELRSVVERHSRLLTDLALDSFALLQLAALLWDLGEVEFPENLEISAVTLGECYDWYCSQCGSQLDSRDP